MHRYVCAISDIEELFKKHNCDCVEVEVTDFQEYTDVECNPVIPDAVKKVDFSFTTSQCVKCFAKCGI